MYEQRIKQFPLFSVLPQSEIRHLANSLNFCEFDEGTFLLKEGEEGVNYYILIEGEVEIIKAYGTTDERSLAVRGSGSFLGEMSLLSHDNLHTASVRSLTPLKLLEMTSDDFEKLLARRPKFALEMMRTLSHRLDESEDLTIRDLRRKNRELLQAYKDLEAAQALLIEQERLERELELARQIQESILPHTLPKISNFDFGVQIMPMAAVGGDFYDFIALDEDCLAVVVGDVTDHGIPAALFMALTVTLLRAESQRSSDPNEVLRSVNQHLLKMNQTGMFVTVFYGIMNCQTSEFKYARAGHELPLLVDMQGELHPVDKHPGQPLALFDDPDIDEGKIDMPSQALLVLYTDGVTDTENSRGTVFGHESLLSSMRRDYKQSAQDLCQSIWEELEKFRGEVVQHDDVTLVAIKMGQNAK